jgi:hypothetical protein
MKALPFFLVLFLLNLRLFAQWGPAGDPLTIGELKLNTTQQLKITKIDKEAIAMIDSLQQNDGANKEAEISRVKGARIKQIRIVMSPDQQSIWRKKMLEDSPHRGVTGKPNERTAK